MSEPVATFDLSDLDGVNFDANDPAEQDELEAPDSSAPDPSTEATSEIAADTAIPRDDKGRFTKSPAIAATETDGAPMPLDSSASIVAGTSIQQSPETPAPSWAPFSVRVNKEDVPIEGAFLSTKDGHAFLTIPEGQLESFKQQVSRGVYAERQWRELQAKEQQLTEREKQPTAKETQLGFAVQEFAKVFADQDMLMEVATNPQARALWLGNLELGYKRTAFEFASTRQQHQTKQAETVEREQSELSEIAETVREIARDPENKLANLTPQDIEEGAGYFPQFRSALVSDGEGGARVLSTNPMLEWLVKRDALRAEMKKATQTKATADRFNGTPVAKPVAKPVPVPVKAGAAAPNGKGEKPFSEVMRDWRKKPGLAFGDEDDE